MRVEDSSGLVLGLEEVELLERFLVLKEVVAVTPFEHLELLLVLLGLLLDLLLDLFHLAPDLVHVAVAVELLDRGWLPRYPPCRCRCRCRF